VSVFCSDEDLRSRLADELEEVRRMLDRMGEELSADLQVLMRHGVPLQTVDIAGQILGYVANVVRASDPAAAVDGIGMCELRTRLQRQTTA
jgi:hypothetical protein